MELLKSLHKNQQGQGMAEYGLIIALVAVVAIAAFVKLGGGIKAQVDKVGGTIEQAN